MSIALLAACGSSERPPLLVSKAELAELEAGVYQRVAETQRQSCPRPVLRGETVPGPAAPDLWELVDGLAVGLDEVRHQRFHAGLGFGGEVPDHVELPDRLAEEGVHVANAALPSR